MTIETTVLKKFTQGSGKPTLRGESDKTTAVLLFTDDAVRIQDMWLEKEPTDRGVRANAAQATEGKQLKAEGCQVMANRVGSIRPPSASAERQRRVSTKKVLT